MMQKYGMIYHAEAHTSTPFDCAQGKTLSKRRRREYKEFEVSIHKISFPDLAMPKFFVQFSAPLTPLIFNTSLIVAQ